MSCITNTEYSVIAPLIMGEGVGDGKTTACLVAQAATIDALRKGQTLDKPTDELHCACPILRRLAIRANDINWWEDNAERTKHLRPLIPLLLDSRGSPALTKRRVAHVTNAVIHELTPMRLEWIAANAKTEAIAKLCRNGIESISKIEPVVDKASAIKARDALMGLKSYIDASAYARASTSAYAYADIEASAYAHASTSAYASADAYEHASAYADVDADAYEHASASTHASAYADADVDADASAAQKLKYRNAYLKLFREVAAMKEESK
jgi:hypothetical protein